MPEPVLHCSRSFASSFEHVSTAPFYGFAAHRSSNYSALTRFSFTAGRIRFDDIVPQDLATIKHKRGENKFYAKKKNQIRFYFFLTSLER